MFALSFRFPGGRYHATPWGRNVNEADVAWPPEPWRLLRAIIAAHRRKADRLRWSENDLEQLVNSLAATLPVYQLPAGAIHAHTRHFMPTGALDKNLGRERTVLVFDAFAHLPKGRPIVVAWKDVVLSARLFRFATDLASSIGYLGRAESWTECEALEEWNGTPNCVPLEPTSSGTSVRLLSPLSPEMYQEERRRLIDMKTHSPRQMATLPESLVEALALETVDYQDYGWSRPPAAREVVYKLEAEAVLRVATRKPSTTSPRRQRKQPTVARFVLAGNPLPRVEDSIKIGELMRRAVLAKFGWQKDRFSEHRTPRAPWQISGRDADNRPLKDPLHAHAFWLPEDADSDGWIDHISVFIGEGIDATIRSKFDQVTCLKLPTSRQKNDGTTELIFSDKWRLALEGFGEPCDFAGNAPIFSKSRRWRTATPFLASGHLKSAGYPGELLRLLKLRRMYVDGIQIESLPAIKVRGICRRAVHFHRFRSRGGERQRDSKGALLKIVFPRPIEGPFAIGYGSHFGLGLFIPDNS